MQKYLSTTHRSVVWFKKASENGELEVRPPFQRNPVWSERQQASLIDTILLEYPIPELYMQELTDSSGKQKHLLVDGQQRIRAILAFLANEFELKDDSPKWQSLAFKDLSEDEKKRIFEYNFVVRLLPDMPDTEVRSIFQRLNKNTMALTPQELRHATYWGPFIKLMEEVSDYEFWNNSGIFSANDRRRMNDVEFISELAVGHLNGLQNKKKNLEEYYQQYETSFEDYELMKGVFQSVLGEINQMLPDLSKTRWRKRSDFYTLFLCFSARSQFLPFSNNQRFAVSSSLIDFGKNVDKAVRVDSMDGNSFESNIIEYARNVERSASDLAARKAREGVVSKIIDKAMENKNIESQSAAT
jgi:hypothetical protein